MKSKAVTGFIWIAAFILTVTLAVFQRMTGPSYPYHGTAETTGMPSFDYRLPRTHGGEGGLEVAVPVPEGIGRGELEWRRYPTRDTWQVLTMVRTGDGRIAATVPQQPPAGKIEYRIVLHGARDELVLPEGEPVVARFRAGVPAWVLIPHILAMFGSMLVATRCFLESLRPSAPDPARSVLVAMALLFVGGMFLGPVVQKFAFNAFWTGWPFGHDLTDNKTLIAVLAWLPATVLALKRKKLRAAVVIGWIVMMGVFLIPHSLRGSEMDWSEGEVRTGRAVVSMEAELPT